MTAVPLDVSFNSRSRWSLYAPKIRSLRDCGRSEPVKNAAFVGAIVGVHHAIGITGLGPSWFVLWGDGGGGHVADGPHPWWVPAVQKLPSSFELGAVSVS